MEMQKQALKETDIQNIVAIATERALQACAARMIEAARSCPSGISGSEALIGFAESILEANAKTWPTEGTMH